MDKNEHKTLTPEQSQQIAADIKKENDKFFEEMTRPIENIYIDIEFLQDFRLGALIGLISTDVEYQYIRSQIPKYSMRLGNEPVTSFFPDLGFKEEQVDAFLKEQSNWEWLAMNSPFYETVQDACGLIVDMIAHNTFMKYEKPLKVYIGCTSLLYCVEARRRLAVILADLLDNIELAFIPTSLYEFEEVAIEDYDVYMVASPKKLINHSGLVKKFENMEMTGKVIVGLVEMDTTEEELKSGSTTKEEAIEATAEFCNMFTRFTFAKRVILV